MSTIFRLTGRQRAAHLFTLARSFFQGLPRNRLFAEGEGAPRTTRFSVALPSTALSLGNERDSGQVDGPNAGLRDSSKGLI